MRIGKNSFTFQNVYLKESYTVCGPIEAKGPLRQYFDKCYKDMYLNLDSWEKAEEK